ncbi:MAG: hypothetical protein ACREX6_00345, partial [Casimicrobiaceae bacterium]
DIDKSATSYTFAPNGITFDDDPKQEFINLHAAEQDRKYVANDKNTFPHQYKYTIRVMQGTVACPAYDPWLYNN